jgi:hypothetical protein
VKEEFYSVAFRRTFYESLDQLQRDLDRYVAFYNRQRAHQGYRTQGRTPFQTFLDGIETMQQRGEESATLVGNSISETEVTPEAA